MITDRDLFKTEITKNGQKFYHIPATEKIRAIRNGYEIDKNYGIETEYELTQIETTFGDITKLNTLVIFKAIIRDLTKEGFPIISTGTDSKFFLYSLAKDPSTILEDADFFSKAETGAISRALTNLGIGLPDEEELKKREVAQSAKKTSYKSAVNNTSAPGATTKNSDDMIEKYTGKTVKELRANGGLEVQFDTGTYKLKYNPTTSSYYWSNIDPNAKQRYISTTVE